MKFTLEGGFGHVISGYGPGEVTVAVPRALADGTDAQSGHAAGHEVITSSVIITPERLIRDWAPGRIEDLATAHLDEILALEPEVVLLGCGETLRFPAPALSAHLARAGVGFEVMDTPGACRTYNILMSEGRSVAAGLMMTGGDA